MSWLAVWWGVRRALVYLKRVSEAQLSIAKSLETIARISQDEWEAKHAPRPKGKFISGVMDVEATNKRWKEMNKSEWDTADND